MVQRPFSDDNPGGSIVWRNTSQFQPKHNEALMPPGYAQVKTLFHKMQRPKMSTILSSVETGRGKSTYSKMKIARNENPLELRLARNTFNNITMALLQSSTEESILFQPPGAKNNSFPGEVTVESYYQIPSPSKFFPSVDDRDLQSVEQKINTKDNTIVIPARPVEKDNSSILVKGIFIADANEKSPNAVSDLRSSGTSGNMISSENDEKADFLLEELSGDGSFGSRYSYNVTTNPYTCVIVQGNKADIDAQAQFSSFDIEPSWVVKRQYWDYIFDSRYEALMRSPKWPALNVILLPISHVDSIWKRSFEHYHNNTVSKIISNIVKKLQFYNKLTFTWNEVSHLSQWWKRTSQKSRSVLRKLVKSGRLEITTGGWVQSDEASTHLFGLVHQLIEGHQWLKNHLNYTPKVGWLTDSVTHSPTMPYLLSAAGISKFIITNVHYSWEQFLAEFQISDFIWIQNWDNDKNTANPLNQELNKIGNERYPKNSVLTHYLQFNYDNFKACGPNKNVCSGEFDFNKLNKNTDIHTYNVKQKSEKLLEQYSKTGTISPHNVVIAPLGGPYRYEFQTEFDYQYNNYQKLADFINLNTDIYKANIDFGTPSDYFNTILSKHKAYPTLQGDFLNFADIKSGSPAYWTGFFTSRPLLKILIRRLQSTLRSTEILLTFAINYNVFTRHNSTSLLELLTKARETVARLQDRHVVGGTIAVNILQYIYKIILSTVKDCWHIQEVAASLLTMKPDNSSPYLHKLVYREGEFISVFRTVDVGDQIYVFNSLSQERTEIVELITKHPNIRVVDHNKKDLTIQINPVWTYSSDNYIRISNVFYKVMFAIVVPPMTLELYKIKETYDATNNAATIYCVHCTIDNFESQTSVFPFNILPLQPGDIQLESYKHRIIIDELTGFLKTVIEKETNTEKTVLIDYGAFKSADVNAGIFLFNTNVTRPLHDILLPFRDGTKTKVSIIIAGQVTTEMSSVYGRLLQHTVKLYNLVNVPLAKSIYIESKLDYEISPKNRELEIFLSIKTEIANGNHPEIYTDNNGFQHTARILNISRRIESNIYPITSMAFIQDAKSRLTLITDHAQGVTSLQEGHLVVMLDRRVLFNDGRGTQEGLADSTTTYHRHFILLENFVDSSNQYSQYISRSELKLPSFSALYLANSVDNILDLFVVDKKLADLSHYAFLPLIKTSFPCDVTVVNFRTIVNRHSLQLFTPNMALLVLQRQSVSCRIDNAAQLNCNGDSSFSLEKILRNVIAVYHTNLVGTNEGVPIGYINQENFPPMELMTLKIFF
ncbi:alpha-mannosidase 2-like [Ostrinia furnacalis]|uniref:alpha-mannosidase 2-like n=1 Tax=Ostrinia furnacalis TaxID=93504 RepID=UPI00103C71E6|nr:alpha-mannosidase 2-like [Ostrinia furnacalis]